MVFTAVTCRVWAHPSEQTGMTEGRIFVSSCIIEKQLIENEFGRKNKRTQKKCVNLNNVPLATGVGGVKYAVTLSFFKGIWSQRMNHNSNCSPPKALLGFLGFRRLQKKRENNEDV